MASLKISYLVFAVGLVILSVFIFYPVLFILYGSFWSANPGFPGHFTLGNYISVLGSSQTYGILANTILYALGSAVFAVVDAIVISYIVTRTDTPLRGVFHYVQYFPLALPAYITNLAWINLFDTRSGLFNVLAQYILGFSLFNIYSMSGMIWATGIAFTPLSYIIISPAMRAMNPSLEESSKASGAGSIQTFFRIVFPLVLPATLSAFVLDMALGVEAFETAVMIGVPARVQVFMSAVYYDVSETAHPDYNVAATYGAVLLIITSLLFYTYYRSLKFSSKYQVVTGRGYSSKVSPIGRWKYLALAFLVGYVTISVIVPFLVVVLISLVPFWNPYNLLANLSFAHYAYLFSSSEGVLPILVRSILSSAAAATLVSVLALAIAFVVYRSKLRGRSNLERIGMLPLTIPSLLIGYGLLWAFLTIRTGLYDTIGVVIIAFSLSYLPQGLRIMSGAFVQIHSDLEEASRVAGAGAIYTLRRIFVPLVRGSVIGGWIFVFIVSFKAVGNIVLLTTSQNQVFSTFVWSLFYAGSGPAARGETAAACVIMMVMLWALIGIMLVTQRRMVPEELAA